MTRAEGLNSKARRAKRAEVLEEWVPSHQLIRECYKLPQWGPGQSSGDLAI